MNSISLKLKIVFGVILIFSFSVSHASEYTDAVKLLKEKRYEEAVALFQSAANSGDAKAKLTLAEMYKNGVGVNKNLETAYKLYLEVAETNIAYAQNMVGIYNRDGIGIPKNLDMARQWFRKAFENGDPNAAKNLEKLYDENKTTQSGQSKLDLYGNPIDDTGAVWVGASEVVIGKGSKIGKDLSALYKDLCDLAYQRGVESANAETAKNMGNSTALKYHRTAAKSYDSTIISKSKEFEDLWEAQPTEYRMKFTNPDKKSYSSLVYRKNYYTAWLTINKEGHLDSVLLQDPPNPGLEIYRTKYAVK